LAVSWPHNPQDDQSDAYSPREWWRGLFERLWETLTVMTKDTHFPASRKRVEITDLGSVVGLRLVEPDTGKFECCARRKCIWTVVVMKNREGFDGTDIRNSLQGRI